LGGKSRKSDLPSLFRRSSLATRGTLEKREATHTKISDQSSQGCKYFRRHPREQRTVAATTMSNDDNDDDDDYDYNDNNYRCSTPPRGRTEDNNIHNTLDNDDDELKKSSDNTANNSIIPSNLPAGRRRLSFSSPLVNGDINGDMLSEDDKVIKTLSHHLVERGITGANNKLVTLSLCDDGDP